MEGLSIHLDRGIFCTHKQSDGLFTRPDGPNTLTCQSAVTNDAPREPLHNHVTCSGVTLFVVDGTYLLSGNHPP